MTSCLVLPCPLEGLLEWPGHTLGVTSWLALGSHLDCKVNCISQVRAESVPRCSSYQKLYFTGLAHQLAVNLDPVPQS